MPADAAGEIRPLCSPFAHFNSDFQLQVKVTSAGTVAQAAKLIVEEWELRRDALPSLEIVNSS